MEEQTAHAAALWETIEKQYALLEIIAGVALNLPRLLIETLTEDGAFRLGDSGDFVESALNRIAKAHPDEPEMCNVIATLIRELRAARPMVN